MLYVLFFIVMSLNVLNCKKDDKIDLSLTQKEAAFVLNVLSSLIQNDTEEPGHDYKSDDSDESTKQGYYIIPAPKSNDMVEGTDAQHTVPISVVSILSPKNNGWSIISTINLIVGVGSKIKDKRYDVKLYFSSHGEMCNGEWCS